MGFDSSIAGVCTRLLHQELVVAMGCTEPVSIAYAAAYARHVLGKMPQRIQVLCSGNVIKNAKAVTVPKTGGLRGIEAAAMAGTISGQPQLQLEVLSQLTDDDRALLTRLLSEDIVTVKHLKSEHMLHIVVKAQYEDEEASVEIVDSHTGVGEVWHNGEKLQDRCRPQNSAAPSETPRLSVQAILQYADTVDLDEVRDVLQRQIDCNSQISEEGLSGMWGSCVGQTLAGMDRQSLYTRLKMAAAAGSDARMNGCALPVVINSGSGNQGMTASLPVIQYARHLGADNDKLLRALCVSNLVSLHQKAGIGRLSAYCGVVCAATGSAAAIAYLDGADYNCIANTIINSIANAGGMVCDGAKSSCAAKIATALESALLGYEMAKEGRHFLPGEGIVKEDVEKTIQSVGRMASVGMRATDAEILAIMLDD
ncbi:L-serine ammonia-lyase, iron-sulfur-dependent, subunit alpha [Clostridia bacterium OttesenSCG-928-O13]|nr:L-serine ammonia-lyase, iron-sulfur-dependent, subunit alpha [Clostridia bacterium OttesenSCG-928-O13]